MTTTLRRAAPATAILIFLLVPAASAAQPQSLTVDCTRGQTISHVLEQGDARKPLVLTIRGTCTEFVSITRDDVTLQGDPETQAIVNAPSADADAITVRATRIVIDQLNVMGGRNSITVNGALDVGITNSVVQDAAQSGINLMNSHARVTNSTIQGAGTNGVSLLSATALLGNNQIRSNAAAGVTLNRSSGVSANGNTISSNGSNGIELNAGSQGRITANTITDNGKNGVFVSFSNADILNGNSITNHPQSGVAADGSVLSVSNNTITGNHSGGVSAYLGSILVVTGGTISDNTGIGVLINANSTGQISGANIHNNTGPGISLLFRSKLQLVPPSSDATGNGGGGLECRWDSSALIYAPLIGDVTPSCVLYYPYP